ncbi:hypothetical protein ACFWDZ_25865 [Micromonospora aurantiaca]|uniref:Uncharacterized protein n=1 Tax=Micromonospora aurantiaca (nom. illeg.) TaxID=47850 RepID=A0A6N3K7B0_9ACTN|nr:hypothetical protein [Micromonospora aurantiaca]AXH93552.1 hypothetical protein DVH21_28530 [Micromonospora aurantiaca]
MSAAAQLTADAARLIGYGLRPRLVPTRDHTYRGLVLRARTDDEFAAAVQAVAAGLDLVVLEISDRSGIVIGSTEDSVFAVKMAEYARRTGGEGKAAERVLHALAHLGAATLAFPRPADLADETYLGRITVEGVEAFVREAASRLAEAAAEADAADAAAAQPGLEAAWRVYTRRARTGSTGDGRKLSSSTTGIVSKALAFLADHGLLTRTSDERGGTFRTTPRYRAQVREAGVVMFEELLGLGITEMSDGSATIAVGWTAESLDQL